MIHMYMHIGKSTEINKKIRGTINVTITNIFEMFERMTKHVFNPKIN